MKQTAILLAMAWRNLRRSKRRTILTLLTILVGCAMIILINAFNKGGHDEMIDDAVSMNTGHIQIHEAGYWGNMSVDYAFQPSATLIRAIETDPGVVHHAKRVHAGGLIAVGNHTRGVLIQGVDPENETKVTELHQKILPGGRYFTPQDYDRVIIGSALAKNTGVGIGDAIALVSQGFDGSIAAERLTVVGIFKSGNPFLDRELVLTPLSLAEQMFSMMGFYHAITIKIEDISQSGAVVARLTSVEGDGKTETEVMGWDRLMPELVQFIVMDDISGYIFDFILFMVVAFGVLNTIQMSVFERTREFGVMMAIGTRPGQIRSLVLIETIMIALMGIVLGTVVGVATSYYFECNPIDFSAYADEIAVWGMTTTLVPADATVANILTTGIITFACAVIFSIFPARRASKLKPVDAIRQL